MAEGMEEVSLVSRGSLKREDSKENDQGQRISYSEQLERRNRIDKEKEVVLKFHVMLSQDVMQPDNPWVLLDDKYYEMWTDGIRPKDMHACQWVAEAVVPRGTVCKMHYRFCCLKDPGGMVNEHLPGCDKDTCRIVIEDKESDEVWHQYGGMYGQEPPKKSAGLFAGVKTFLNLNRNDSQEQFVEQLKKAQITQAPLCRPLSPVASIVVQTQQMILCTENLLQTLGLLESKIAPHINQLTKEVVRYMLSCVREHLSDKEPDHSWAMTAALGALKLDDMNKLSVCRGEAGLLEMVEYLTVQPGEAAATAVKFINTSFKEKVKKRELVPCLTRLVELGVDIQQVAVLQVMPLLHFLSKQCVPNEPISFEPYEWEEGWEEGQIEFWGLDQITKQVQILQGTHQENLEGCQKLKNHLEPLFDTDPLLPRLFVAACGHHQITHLYPHPAVSPAIPPELLMLDLWHQLHSYKDKHINDQFKQSWKETLQYVKTILDHDDSMDSREKDYLPQLQTLMAKVCEKVLTHTDAEVLLAAANLVTTLHQLVSKHSVDKQDDANQSVISTQKDVNKWMIRLAYEYTDGYPHGHLIAKAFDALYNIQFPTTSVYTQGTWQTRVTTCLHQLLRSPKLKDSAWREVYLSTDTAQLAEPIAKLVHDRAVSTVDHPERLKDVINEAEGLKVSRTTISLQLRRLLSSALTTLGSPAALPQLGLPAADDANSYFDNAVHFLDLLAHHDKLDDKWRERLDHLAALVLGRLNDAVNGKLTERQIIWSVQHHDTLCNIAKRFPKFQHNIKELLGLRSQELKQLNISKKDYNDFIAKIEQVLKVRIKDDFREKLSVTTEQKMFSTLVDPRMVPGDITLRYFEDSPMSLADVRLFLDSYVTSAFKKLLLDHYEPFKRKSDLNQVKEILQEWKRLCDSLADRSAQLKDVIKYFYHDEPSNLYAEVKVMLGKSQSPSDDVQACCNDVIRLCKVIRHNNVIHCMLKLKEVIGLTEDFSSVQKLINLHERNMSLKDLAAILEHLVGLDDVLLEIANDAETVLGLFCQCQTFIVWMHEFEDGHREASDFARYAIDQNRQESERIRRLVDAFHSVVTCLGPTIFSLRRDMGVTEFIELCKQICHKINDNADIKAKMINCHENIEWLKKCKDMLGNFKLKHIESAERLNLHGTYHVGRLAGVDYAKVVDDLIVLVVDEGVKVDQGEGRYHLADLQKTRNLLMLVVGESLSDKAIVDTFVEMLDGVTRLATTLLQLEREGSMLAQSFTATFTCNPSAPSRNKLYIGLLCTERITETDTTPSECPPSVAAKMKDVQIFLDRCQCDWTKHMAKVRRQSPQLNLFTCKQLAQLREDFSKLWRDKYENLTANTYHLLHQLCPYITTAAIRDIVREAKSQLAPQPHQTSPRACGAIPSSSLSSKNAMTVSATEGENLNLNDEQRKLFDELQKVCKNKRQAYKAITRGGVTTVREGVQWVDDDEDESDDDEDESHENEDTKPSEDNLSQTQQTSTLRLGVRTSPFLKELSSLWSSYMKNIVSEGASSDLLSLQGLALCLQKIIQPQYNLRPRPFSEEAGKSNIVICKAEDIYKQILHFYLSEDMDEKEDVEEEKEEEVDQALPNSDEILICDNRTTFEEVQLLLSRADADTSSRLYCLVHADRLSHAISEQLEDALLAMRSREYRLLVVCADDGRDSPVASQLKGQKGVTTQLKETTVYATRLQAALRCPTLRPPTPQGRPPTRDQSPTDPIPDSQPSSSLQDPEETLEDNPPDKSLDPDRCSIRLVLSPRAGLGKTMRVMAAAGDWPLVKVSIHGRRVTAAHLLDALTPHAGPWETRVPTVYHIDIDHEVDDGLDEVLFKLLVLGKLEDHDGRIWCRSPRDYYLIEHTPALEEGNGAAYVHKLLHLLPAFVCCGPDDTLAKKDFGVAAPLFEAADSEWTRAGNYLQEASNEPISQSPKDEGLTRLKCILEQCNLHKPSWAELHYYVKFLSKQLLDYQNNPYLDVEVEERRGHVLERIILQRKHYSTLPGFKDFVLKLLIQMSKDFAAQLPIISLEQTETGASVIMRFTPKQLWETKPHPYIFFNAGDCEVMTFWGFNVDPETCKLIDPESGALIEGIEMAPVLVKSLELNNINLSEKFHSLSRENQLKKLCCVMGIPTSGDTWQQLLRRLDKSYVITSDNARKMVAIYMRLRCDIPVVLMGETGCGKTRLIHFLCELQRPASDVRNVVLVKVHGGTTEQDLADAVVEAEALLLKNLKQQKAQKHDFFTVLFFDEANTTEAVGAIREIMCDRTIQGRVIHPQLKVVAACNPYRLHNEEYVQRLERAGLGYHVQAAQSTDTCGSVPMRQLVYRVQPLPDSLMALVWDFGLLNDTTEQLYIRQMVDNFVCGHTLTKGAHSTDDSIAADDTPVSDDEEYKDLISQALSECQQYMRTSKEADRHYVSLRDVERTFCVMEWFYEFRKQLFNRILLILKEMPSDAVCALMLALGVCYYTKLEDRDKFSEHMTKFFREHGNLSSTITFEKLISGCQDVFIQNAMMDRTIAHNSALKENFFMMVVCVQLGIPLFLVGKPGSSKSLAKIVLEYNMSGENSEIDFFKNLKEVLVKSFQCSQMTKPETIQEVFDFCVDKQKERRAGLTNFAATVVLDEVGLAEDSPTMPLKILHSLLEEGFSNKDTGERYRHVPFIGISNWALDPAKMNRAIYVQCRDISGEELADTAKKICDFDASNTNMMQYCKIADECYQDLCRLAKNEYGRQFFGLRDYYSVMKAIQAVSKLTNGAPSSRDVIHAIRRNFGGVLKFDAARVFAKKLPNLLLCLQGDKEDPHLSIEGLIRANIDSLDSRYLLVMTEKGSALELVQRQLPQALVLRGSCFPSDEQYTQVCRIINMIKVCMGLGRPVILMQLGQLYESLYDALNQCFMRIGEHKFVNLGLGTDRVLALVHGEFRLVLVAELEEVRLNYPIPLINRLEKQFLTLDRVLSKEQKKISDKLNDWALQLTNTQATEHARPTIQDTFVGYQAEIPASIVLTIYHEKEEKCLDVQEVEDQARLRLLQCVTPDALFRLEGTSLRSDAAPLINQYSSLGADSGLHAVLEPHTQPGRQAFVQVTTHSSLTNTARIAENLQRQTGVFGDNIFVKSVSAYDTEQQFNKMLQEFFGQRCPRLLVLTYTCLDHKQELLQSVRHAVINSGKEAAALQAGTLHTAVTLLVVRLPLTTQHHYRGFQAEPWMNHHVDELFPQDGIISSLISLRDRSMSSLFLDPATGSEVLNIGILLHSCRHQANMALHDPRDTDTVPCWTNRSQLRLELLTEILQPDKSTDAGRALLEALRIRVGHLMAEKEKTAVNTKSWARKAADLGLVKAKGTLRRAVCARLEQAVVPLLAALLAAADTNCNLQVLQSPGWRCQLFLDMLRVPGLLVPANRQGDDGLDFPVLSLGEGHHFACRLPLSWIIKQQLDAVMGDAEAGELCTFFSLNPLGQALMALDGETVRHELVQDYLHDYVHMVYRPGSSGQQNMDSEFETVKGLVWRHARHLVNEGAGDWHCSQLQAIHVAHSSLRARLQLLGRMLALHPELGQELAQNTEMDHDVLALHLVLSRTLQPKEHTFSTPQLCTDWLTQAECVQSVVMEMLRAIRSVGDRDKLEQCRNFATRLRSIRLFVTHVNNKDDQVKYTLNFDYLCIRLWEMLEKANLKTLTTMKDIESVLRSANSNAAKAILWGNMKKCRCCSRKTNPVLLPCDHMCAYECVADLLRSEKIHVCPLCRVAFPDTFPLQPLYLNKERLDDFDQHKRRVNSFYMAMLSQLVFSDDVPPEDDLVKHLLGWLTCSSYVTPTDKPADRFVPSHYKFVFDDSSEQSPTVLAVLLRLLLTNCTKRVETVLDSLLQTSDPLTIFTQRRVTMLLHALEDTLMETHLAGVTGEGGGSEELRTAVTDLTAVATRKGHATDLTYSAVRAVAAARLVLQQAAACIAALRIPGSVPTRPQTSVIECAQNLCGSDPNPLKRPRMYLLRLLNRSIGFESIQKMTEIRAISWLLPSEFKHLRLTQDVCACMGDKYLQLRDILQRARKDASIEASTSVDPKAVFLTEEEVSLAANDPRLLILALFWVIYGQPPQKGDTEVVIDVRAQREAEQIRDKFFDESKDSTYWNMWTRLASNQLCKVSEFLRLTEKRPLADMRLVQVAMHCHLVVQNANSKLLQSLQTEVLTSEAASKLFLPTMPREALKALIEVLNADDGLVEKTKLWRCANGHPYIIGNCGQPWGRGKCPWCGLPIGGIYHMAFGGSKTSKDWPEEGHCLGSAQDRAAATMTGVGALPALPTALLRLLLHLSMMLAMDSKGLQAVERLVTTPRDEPIDEFLWAHVQLDVMQIGQLLAKNDEDTVVVLHLWFDFLATKDSRIHDDPGANWLTMMAREKWEETANKQLVQPFLLGIEDKLQTSQKKIIDVAEPYVKQIFEMLPESAWSASQSVHQQAALWRTRPSLSLQQAALELDRDSSPHPILKAFFSQERFVRALWHLPAVVQLLVQAEKHLPSLRTRPDADRLTVQDYIDSLQDAGERAVAVELVANWTQLWALVRHDVFGQGGRSALPDAVCCEAVGPTSSLWYLAPSHVGEGLCTLLALQLLVDKQSQLVIDCAQHRHTTVLPSVGIRALTPHHVVALRSADSLRPLLVANCTYTRPPEGSAQAVYDFSGLQRGVDDTYINTRPPLTMDMKPFASASTSTTATQLREVSTNIFQESLSPNLQSDLESGPHDISVLNDVISAIEVAIGYLAKLTVAPDKVGMSLVEFVTQDLHKDCDSLQVTVGASQLCHVRALWLTLTHERTKLMYTTHKEDPFPALGIDFKVPLPATVLRCDVVGSFSSSIVLHSVLFSLYEFYTMYLAPLYAEQDSLNMGDWKLSEALANYDLVVAPSEPRLADIMAPTVLLQHSVDTWQQICKWHNEAVRAHKVS